MVVEIVVEVLEDIICNFLWFKVMCWGVGVLCWVWFLYLIFCLIMDEVGVIVVLMDVDGIVVGDIIEGYCFMGNGCFVVIFFEDYEV